jgi:4-hydroxy-tetrahydrodipicolinate synthase
MVKIKVEGSFVALITPYNRDGTIDFEGFRTLIDFQACHGTSALLIMGSTGEVSMLSQAERRHIITKTVKFRKADMLLFYGCTGNTTQSTIDMVRYAAGEGADGAIITVPSYICPSVDDAVAYCLEVADASDIPIGIYNNPSRVGTDLPAEAIIRLAEHPNIVVDKEATTRPGQIAQIAAARKELSLMCCDSPHLGHVMQVMALGGQGTANMTGNIAPQEMAIISKPWASFDDAEQCRETFLRLLPLFHFHYSRINPVPVKSLAKALGLPAGDLRKPYRNLEGAELKRGVEIVRALGLVEKYHYPLSGALRRSA